MVGASMRASRATATEPLGAGSVAHGPGDGLRPAVECWRRAIRAPGADHLYLPVVRLLIVMADRAGRGPLYRVGIDTGTATPPTDDGVWASPRSIPTAGLSLPCMRPWTSPRTPCGPSWLATRSVAVLHARRTRRHCVRVSRSWLSEVTAEAADGTPLRAWLVLPDGARAGAPAPLRALGPHGGPVSSWNGWHWRWNPSWVLAARGYAVLLPGPGACRLATE